MKEILDLRGELKAKKPNFVRQQGKNLKKLKQNWRAPKGMHSKLRKKIRGKSKRPSIGYSSPKKVRGLDKSGLIPVQVGALNQLDNISKGQGIVISKKVGKKKKVMLLKAIKEKGLVVLNIKDVEKCILAIEEGIKKNKVEKEKKEKEKEKSKRESVEKGKKKEEKELTPEEKEKQEKEEKRKVLEAKK